MHNKLIKLMPNTSIQPAVKLENPYHDTFQAIISTVQVNEIINTSIENFTNLMEKQKKLCSRSKLNLVYQFSGKFAEWNLKQSELWQFHSRRVNQLEKRRKRIKVFGADDLRLLVWIVNKYGNLHKIKNFTEIKQTDWQAIAIMIPTATWESCMLQILKLQGVTARENKWTPEQSQLLLQIAQEIDDGVSDKWKKVSLELYLRNPQKTKTYRSRKQCNDRFLNLCLSGKKKNWDLEEDIKLLKGFIQHSHKRAWAREIHRTLGKKTASSIRRRAQFLINKQEEKQESKGLTKEQLANAALEAIFESQPNLRDYFEAQEAQDLQNIGQENLPVKLEQEELWVKLEDSQNQDYVNYLVPYEEEFSQRQHIDMQEEEEIKSNSQVEQGQINKTTNKLRV